MNLWNLKARFYSFFRKPWPLSWIYKREQENIFSLTSKLPPFDQASICIDVACGCGESIKFLPAHTQIFCADKSFNMTKICTRKNQKPGITADACTLPFKDDSVDFIIAIGLSEYLDSLDNMYSEFYHVLKNGGSVIFTSSPKGLFTFLRKVGGTKIYSRNSNELIATGKKNGFELVALTQTFSQHVFLLEKIRRDI